MCDHRHESESPFFPIEPDRVVFENEDVIAFYDRYPISPGHTLVIAKQITASLYELPEALQSALWRAVGATRAILKEKHDPDAFNIGVNDGAAAAGVAWAWISMSAVAIEWIPFDVSPAVPHDPVIVSERTVDSISITTTIPGV